MKTTILIPILFLFSVSSYPQLIITDGTDLYVESLTTLYVTGDINSDNATIWNYGTIDFKGKLENNSGSLFEATSTGTFKFSGTTAQEITGDHNAGFYGITELDNASGLGLTATFTGTDQTVNGELKFTSGKLTLNEFNLLLGAVEPTGFSADNYVLTNNSGMLKRTVAADGISMVYFPVGNSSYNPVFLQNSPTAATDTYGVRVEDQEPAGLSTPHFVDRSWIITEEVAEGSDLTVIPQWNGLEELTPFNRDNCAVGQVSGSGPAYGWATYGAALGDDPYYREGDGFTDAGTFTVSGNSPPVAVCQDVIVSADENCEGFVTAEMVDNGSSDPDGDPVTLSLDPPGPYSLGETVVTLTVTDDLGASDQCTATVSVNDVTAPVADTDLLPDLVGECSVTITTAPTATDNCAGAITGTTTDPLTYAEPGTYTVTWTYEDDNGNSSVQQQTIVVDDDTSPVITVISTPIILWPPNHKYASFVLSDFVLSVSDNCADVSVDEVNIARVTSDEPENAEGGDDGNTLDDIVIAEGCKSVQLRKERQGDGNGRVYTIHFEMEDDNGNIGVASCQVHVPKNNNGTAIDDGPVYQVTGDCDDKSLFVSEIENVELTVYPNPFKTFTTIAFTMPETKKTILTIYNARGVAVSTLFDAVAEAGFAYKIEFSGNGLPQGLYIVHLQSGDDTSIVKKVLISR